MSRMLKSLAVVASAALVLGAMFVGPADAKKKKKKPKPTPTVATCPVFTPVAPADAEEADEATTVPVTMVTDAHTADAPLTLEYEHGPAIHDPALGTPLQTDVVWFNLQIDSALETAGLYIRQEWSGPGDMDLYVYDSTGAEATHSGSANLPEPLGGPDSPTAGRPLDQTSGAMGYESISGFAAPKCAGYSVESRAFLTDGVPMTLKVWLGEVVAAE